MIHLLNIAWFCCCQFYAVVMQSQTKTGLHWITFEEVNTANVTCLGCSFKSLGFCNLPADWNFLSDLLILRFILKSREHSQRLLYTTLAIIGKQTVQLTEMDGCKEQRAWTGLMCTHLFFFFFTQDMLHNFGVTYEYTLLLIGFIYLISYENKAKQK